LNLSENTNVFFPEYIPLLVGLSSFNTFYTKKKSNIFVFADFAQKNSKNMPATMFRACFYRKQSKSYLV